MPYRRIAVLCAALGGACASTESETAEAPLRFEAVAVRSAPASVVAGHPVAVESRLRAGKAFDPVLVQYYLVSAADERKQYFVGQHFVAAEARGEIVQRPNLLLPGDVPAGDYQLIGYVDPDGQVAASTRDRVAFTDGVRVGGAVDTPNLVVEAFTAADDVLLVALDPAAPAAELSGTAQVVAYGAPAEGAGLTACLRVDAWSCEPLEIWRSADQAFGPALTLGRLEAGVPVSVQLDVRLTAAARSELVARHAFTEPTDGRIEVTVNGDQRIAELGAEVSAAPVFRALWLGEPAAGSAPPAPLDNTVVRPVTLYRAPAVGCTGSGLSWGLAYGKTFSNSRFGAGIALDAAARLGWNGIFTTLGTSAPITLFGTTDDLFNGRAEGSLPMPRAGDAYAFAYLKFMGYMMYEKNLSGMAVDISLLEKSWEKEWSKEAGPYWISVVPVMVEAGASATLGLDGTLHLEATNSDNSATVSVVPSAGVEAFGDAGVGIWGFSAGVRADLSLVKDEFTPAITAAATYLPDFPAPVTGVSAQLSISVINTLSGPDGTFGLYAKWTTVRWCKAWGVPYPCGTDKHEGTYPLVSWAPFDAWGTVLLDVPLGPALVIGSDSTCAAP
jgi:hypothetical protein